MGVIVPPKGGEDQLVPATPKVRVKVVQMNFSCKRTLNFQGVNYEETIEVEFEGTPQQQKDQYMRVRQQLADRVTEFAESQVRQFGGDV